MGSPGAPFGYKLGSTKGLMNCLQEHINISFILKPLSCQTSLMKNNSKKKLEKIFKFIF